MWSQLPEDTNDLRVVMVWIHGGAFVTGSGTSVMFGPDHLLTEDIVFVSINYRLGVLGIANTNIYLRKPLHVCMCS
jgi:carboxylesterase type B